RPRELHRSRAAIGGGVPCCRQSGAAPRREALHHLMGSPVDHGAFLVPDGLLRRWTDDQEPARLQCFGRFLPNRLEELNTYSDALTRFFRVSGGFAERRFDAV